jgi:G3E family GTPase
VNEAEMQIAFADRILLNKCDLVTAEDAEALTTRIRTMNTLAPIQQCERCAVELSWILDVHAFDPQKAKELEQSLIPLFDGLDGKPGLVGQFQNLLPISDGGGDGRQLTPKHDQTVRTVALQVVGRALDAGKVESWLAGLLWEDGEDGTEGEAAKPELFRIKGVIWGHGCVHFRCCSSFTGSLPFCRASSGRPVDR